MRVNDSLYAAAREKLDDIARAHGFEGKLVVLGEPSVGVGDCRIEWADGGVNREASRGRRRHRRSGYPLYQRAPQLGRGNVR